MTYAQGSTIQATDYNTLVSNGTNIGDHWGVGTGRRGLGQSTTSIATVSTANDVSAVQWTGLIGTINKCLAHEGQTAITPSGVTAGDLITYYAAIATGSALAYTQAGTTGYTLTDSAASTATYSLPWGTTAYSTNQGLLFTHTVTFSSGDAARYFFNAGGKLKLSYARSGGTVSTINADWTALCTACSTLNFGYLNTTKVGGSGTPTTLLSSSNGGYWNTTTSGVTHFLQYDSAAGYTTNYITVTATWSGTASNGGYPVVTFKTYWIDAHNVGANPALERVDGTATTSLVVASPPTTAGLTDTWGTPTVTNSVALY